MVVVLSCGERSGNDLYNYIIVKVTETLHQRAINLGYHTILLYPNFRIHSLVCKCS